MAPQPQVPPRCLASHQNTQGPGWSFNATASRKRATAGACLEGFTFYITRNKDAPKKIPRFADDDLAYIIRAGGGTLLEKPPRAGCGATIVVTTEEERPAWTPLAKNRQVTILSANALLTCVMRQCLDASEGTLQ